MKPTEHSPHTGSHDKEQGHGDSEPTLTKRVAVHAKLAQEMKKEGISCEALPYGSHKLEREASYCSHNFTLSSRLVTNKGLIKDHRQEHRLCPCTAEGINMPKQDPVPLPYGSLQYYQAHYILESESKENASLLARCKPVTRGSFGDKRVVAVRWTSAGEFAESLQSDAKVTDMLNGVMLREGEIRVDPLDDHIRIYGRWLHEAAFEFNQTMLEIADRIAGHIKARLRALGELH